MRKGNGNGTYIRGKAKGQTKGLVRHYGYIHYPTGKRRVRGPWAKTEGEAYRLFKELEEKELKELGTASLTITRDMKFSDAMLLVGSRTKRGKVTYGHSTIIRYRAHAQNVAAALPHATVKDCERLESAYAVRRYLETPRAQSGKRQVNTYEAAPESVRKGMFLYAEMLDQAELCRAIKINPLKNLPAITHEELRSEPKPLKVTPKKERRYSVEEYEAIIGSVDPEARQMVRYGKRIETDGNLDANVYRIRLYQLQAATGLRLGEAVGLLWRNVHIGDRASGDYGYVVKALQISDAHRSVETNKPYLGPIKARDGSRPADYVYFDWATNDMLKKHLAEWREDALLSGYAANWRQPQTVTEYLESYGVSPLPETNIAPQGYVFPGITGEYMRTSTINKSLKSLSKRLGIYKKKRATHGYRRKLATELLAAMPMDFVAKHLGHKVGTDVTAIYADAEDNLFKRAADTALLAYYEQKEAN